MTMIGTTFGGVAVDTILSDPAKFAENLRKAQSAINEKVKPNGDFDLFSYQTEVAPMTAEEEALEAEENAYINEIDIEADVGEEERARRIAERAKRVDEVDAKRDARYLERLSRSISAAAFDDQNLLLVARGGSNLQVSTYGENPSGKTINLFAIGSTGDDALIGANGNDVLVSGGSTNGFGDILKGGGGTDIFVVSEGLTYIHNLTATSTILVPSFNGEYSLRFPPIESDESYRQNPNISYDESFGENMEVHVDIGGTTELVLHFTVSELNTILGKNSKSLVEAYSMKESEKRTLSSYIMSKIKSSTPNDAQLSTAYKSAIGGNWNYVHGQPDKNVTGTMGRDSIFGKGMNITMTGGAGGDNFHVKAGMGTIIADFNFHQRDRIVMDDVKLADFNRDKVSVERSNADFIVKYEGKTIAKLLNYEGMPRTDAAAMIKALVTGS